MVKGLLGKKLGMTRIFTENGLVEPVTVLEAGPCKVVQRKTFERDGYDAVQIGFGEKPESRCNKPERGHFAKNGVPPQRALREFRVEASSELKPGDDIRADIFAVGDRVDVSGVTKGKGFAGVIKRHHFSGGPAAHGSNFKRAPGSIGQSAWPSKTWKNKGLPGHMGSIRMTAQNLEVLEVDAERNLLVVRGSVPGAKGGVVEVRKSVKGSK